MKHDYEKLTAPFPADDIEWRVAQAGERNGKAWARVIAYVTNRAIMSRLDEVFGPDNWQNEFKPGPVGGVVCGLSVWTGPEKGWVTKWDGSDNTNIEAVKGGLSGSMKRAAVQWGIGRYLYNLSEGWAMIDDNGIYRQAKSQKSPAFKWNPPHLPAWALPPEEAQKGNTRPSAPTQEDFEQAGDHEQITREQEAALRQDYISEISNYLTDKKIFSDDERKGFKEIVRDTNTAALGAMVAKYKREWTERNKKVAAEAMSDAPQANTDEELDIY